jgi:hypothetical protein
VTCPPLAFCFIDRYSLHHIAPPIVSIVVRITAELNVSTFIGLNCSLFRVDRHRGKASLAHDAAPKRNSPMIL